MRNEFFVSLRANAIQPFIGLITTLFFIFFACQTATAQLSGVVFRDYDGDGTRDNSTTQLDHGIGGITVKAYDANDPVATPTATTTTAANGTYSMSVPAGSYRVEFSWTLTWLEPGHAGGTTVQMVTAPSSTVNCAVGNPADFNQGNVQLVTTQYMRGDLATIAGNPGIISLFNSDGQSSGTAADATVTDYPVAVDGADIGSTWGLAWDKKRNRIYTSAAVKTQAAMGPNGIGAIYVIDNSANTNTPGTSNQVTSASLWLNLEAPAINKQLGVDPYSVEPYTDAFNDEAFKSVGKHGFGDLEISEDNNTLYAVNLFNRSVLVMPIAANGAAPTSGAAITEVTIPSPASCTDIVRPFALRYRDGKLYVGAICTMEGAIANQNTRNTTVNNARAGLKAYVFEFNPTTNTFVSTPVVEFDLDYERTWGDQELPAAWHPWFDRFCSTMFFGLNGSDRFTFPQPILSDIEFDGCDMVLGFTDRMGNQFGNGSAPQNRLANGSTSSGWSGTNVRAIPCGEMVIAGLNASGTWTVEGDGSVTSVCGNRTAPNGDPQNLRSTLPSPYDGHTGSGPGGSEFFWGDYYSMSHNEVTVGALAVLPGRREVVTTAFDPLQHVSSQFSIGGLMWMNTSNGDYSRGVKLYDGNGLFFGKGAGYGDVEFLLGNASLEVGNVVWTDTDADGVQDPGEPGITGVTVTLWRETAPGVFTSVATTNTGTGGRYGFSRLASGSAPGVAYNVSQLVENETYQIRLLTTQASVSALSLTVANSAASGGITTNDNILDLRDSDASLSGTNAVIQFTTGAWGANNHTLDFGFINCTVPTLSTAVTNVGCNGASTGGINLTVTGGMSPFTYDWSNDGAETPDNDAEDLTSVAAGTYTVTVTTNDGCVATTSATITQPAVLSLTVTPTSATQCTPPNGSINLTVVGGTLPYTYDWSNDGAETPDNDLQDLTGIAGGTYTVTVTDNAGCVATISATITSPGAPTLTGGSVCVGSTITLTGSGTPNGSTPYSSSNPGVATVTSGGVVTGISAGTTTITYTNNSGCQATATVTVTALPAATFTQTAPTCTGTTANNNGRIAFATATNVTHFGISTAGAATYDGPAYPATAFTAVGQNVSTNIPNTGGTYIVRVFNGSASCFSDVTVSVAAVSCAITCIPPVISVIPGTVCVGTSIDLNSLVTGNSPAGTLSFHATLANANAGTNPLVNTVVSPLANATYYVRSTINATCYSVGTLSVTVSTPPTLTVNNGQVCAGGSINLATLVTSGGGGTLSYFTTLANAQNNTNALASSVVAPASATNYFIRSTNAAGCYTIQNVVVSLAAANCGAMQVSGPN